MQAESTSRIPADVLRVRIFESGRLVGQSSNEFEVEREQREREGDVPPWWRSDEQDDRRITRCAHCGEGWVEVTCRRCGGGGEIGRLANPPDPQTEKTARCPDCSGQGVVVLEKAPGSENRSNE